MLFFQFKRGEGATAFDGVTLACDNRPGAGESSSSTDRIILDEHAHQLLHGAFPQRPDDKDIGRELRICRALTPFCRHVASLGMVRAMGQDSTGRELSIEDREQVEHALAHLMHYHRVVKSVAAPLATQAYLAGKRFGWILQDAPRAAADRLLAA